MTVSCCLCNYQEVKHKMLRYFVKRILLAIVTVFIIITITFFTMNAVPGGPFSAEKAPTAAVQAVLEERFNLDKPVGTQFILYLGNILHGDFGISLKTGRPIMTVITESFGISAKLGLMAAAVAVVLGLTFGSIAALTRSGLSDRLIIFFTTLLVSVPSFVLATLLLLVFCLQLKWFPVWSTSNPSYFLPVISLAVLSASCVKACAFAICTYASVPGRRGSSGRVSGITFSVNS